MLSEDINFVQREERSSARTIVNLKFTHSQLNRFRLADAAYATRCARTQQPAHLSAMRFTDQPGLDEVAARAAGGDHPVDLEDADCPAASRAMAGPYLQITVHADQYSMPFVSACQVSLRFMHLHDPVLFAAQLFRRVLNTDPLTRSWDHSGTCPSVYHTGLRPKGAAWGPHEPRIRGIGVWGGLGPRWNTRLYLVPYIFYVTTSGFFGLPDRAQ